MALRTDHKRLRKACSAPLDVVPCPPWSQLTIVPSLRDSGTLSRATSTPAKRWPTCWAKLFRAYGAGLSSFKLSRSVD